jgi:DNA-binding PadR family transcriptional regulator
LEGQTEMLKGVLEGIVLELISRGETYGYEITRRLNELGFTEVVDGTVYTILIRLERNDLVEVAKRPSTIGPLRKFYRLNGKGQRELALFWERWAFLSSKVQQLQEVEPLWESPS